MDREQGELVEELVVLQCLGEMVALFGLEEDIKYLAWKPDIIWLRRY